jgi:hypothetical protein
MTTITVCSTPSQGTTPRLLFTWTGVNLFPVGIAVSNRVNYLPSYMWRPFNHCVSGCLGQTRITARQRPSRRMKGRTCKSQAGAALAAGHHPENLLIGTAYMCVYG